MSLPVLTSTSCRTATTMTSKSEFLHPTITPGLVVFGMSEGQNMRINALCVTMLS